MSTAPVLVKQETWDAFIARVGNTLSELEGAGDGVSWERFRTVIVADAEARDYPDNKGLPEQRVRRKVTNDLKAWWERERRPRTKRALMWSVRRIHDTWNDLVSFKTYILPFDHYRLIATCRLGQGEKSDLRNWAEEHEPSQEDLRRIIRERVDANEGVTRPDFHLMTSNHWVINEDGRLDGFDGGISFEVYANLIHHFSDPGDTVLDPFAGGGLLAETLQRFRHFREETEAEFSGPRRALMSDIAPSKPEIVQADARVFLPFDDGIASLAIIDPPYLMISDGKYATLGNTQDEWLDGIRKVLRQVSRCLSPHGKVAVMTDDVVRKKRHVPTGLLVLKVFMEEGWELITTVYDFNRNFLQMSPMEMSRAKKARLLVNAVKLIQVAQRPR